MLLLLPASLGSPRGRSWVKGSSTTHLLMAEEILQTSVEKWDERRRPIVRVSPAHVSKGEQVLPPWVALHGICNPCSWRDPGGPAGHSNVRPSTCSTSSLSFQHPRALYLVSTRTSSVLASGNRTQEDRYHLFPKKIMTGRKTQKPNK